MLLNIKRVLSTSLISFALLNTTLLANEESTSEPIEIPQTQEEKTDAGMGIFPSMDEVAGSNLETQRDEYLKNRKKRLGFTRKGAYIGWASSSISGGPNSLDFGQKRILAFEKAFADAKAEFVQAKKIQGGVKVQRRIFNDDTEPEINKVKDGFLASVGKKLAALTGAALDKALVELGVDPKELEGSTIEQKRQKAVDSFNKEVTIEAIANVSGVRILATFEDIDGVGVLIVQSPEYAELARAIASRKLVPISSDEDPIDSIASKIDESFVDKNALIPQYGVRIMNDDAGNRVLVSFGQWSPKITKGDSKMKMNMAIKAAKQISYDQAFSYMTQFINTTMAVSNKSKVEGSDSIADLTHSDGSVEKDQETSTIGAKLDRFIKETSSVTIEGVAPIKSWQTNHPDTGHPIVGSVLVWSPVTQDFARQKPKPKATAAKTKQQDKEIKNKVYKSVDLGDDDF